MKRFTNIVLMFMLLLLIIVPAVSQTVEVPEELFANLGVNMTIVAILIAFTSVVKSFLKPESKILKYIAFFPMLVAGLYAFFLGGFADLPQKFVMTFLYAAAAGYLYSLGGNIVKSVINSVVGKSVFTKVK